MSEILAGATETIGFRPLLNGAPVTGASVTARVKRKDGLWLDWADSTFKTFGSVGQIGQTLIADANDTGHYAYAWDTSTITNAVAFDVYAVTIIQTSPFACTVEGEIRTSLVPAVQTAILTAIASIASAVWAVADGSSTMGAALRLLRRRTTNKRILDAFGVLSFFADDGTTIEKTSTVRDVSGTLVSPASGEAAQASAET